MADHFARQHGDQGVRFTREAREALTRYGWPGNVRELRNLIEFLSSLHPGALLAVADLPAKLQSTAPARTESASTLRRGETLDARLMGVEGSLLRDALDQAGGNQSEAARLLGITESRLRLRLRKYGMGTTEGAAGRAKSSDTPSRKARASKRTRRH
ncbi:MAG: helix-turn-helix domain-containing protein [Candidatus Eisenbacteria bacterium]